MSSLRSRLAVLGSPIAHSQSPSIQRAAYRALGLNWHYEAIEMTGERLPTFLKSCDNRWRGLSLTMPLKRDVVALLTHRHELVDRVGGANTVLFTDGAIHGFNTDVRGATESFRHAGITELDTVHMLGAGATAASLLVAVAELGARNVIVSARNPQRAAELVALGAQEGISVTIAPLPGLGSSFSYPISAAPEVIISTIPGGQNGVSFPESVRRSSVLFDVAYDPWPSSLALAWAEAGSTVISGLDLLLFQAVGQVRIFVLGDPDCVLPDEEQVIDAMRAALV